MKKTEDIHNLDSLQAEIYRLKLQAKNIEEKLDKNLEYFQQNCWSMMINSLFFDDANKKRSENGFWKTFFKHEAFSKATDGIAANIADKASERLHAWMNNFFGKHRH